MTNLIQQDTELLILTKLEEKVYFYVPAIEGKRRLRMAITELKLEKELIQQANQMQKSLKRYYYVIKDENGGFRIKF